MADTERIRELELIERHAWDAYRDAYPDDDAAGDAWLTARSDLALARRDG